MATQIRSKQPRPLSIITESSLDDCIDSVFQTESANDGKESCDLDKHSQPRPPRRKSVAPLEHPVDALDQCNRHTEDCSLRDNSVNSGTECTSEKSIHCQKNDRTTATLELCRFPGDTVVSVQNVSSIQKKLFSANDATKMRLQDQSLAAQFLKIRHQMVELRLAVECQNYMELLDGAQEDIEEERELSRMVDIPSELLSPHYSLLHVGLTKMNFSSRRFSTC
ncbi:unnamed protein product [Candidula unifasciata]|uniref:Uncharacterized protein n=1 Tax=Candidula unifasciata TaxID=100452 RepID=A0A8S3Z4W7_9EUPU|nr:unnamed protein product [Candidula unifasciata]